MKLYHICEYCNIVFKTVEIEGQEGAAQVDGTCNECNEELNFMDDIPYNKTHYYN
ncbi:hypothetical protein SYNTR_1944 [Candidatus Syntrophocurvum alkaliphilum]|uniref:Uncharacterized protein n=1 Tax=Candidatus Syntrophocurvum alkaliphilum TaxID=2293317 RepID=A0A6I6DNL6_9FIRM|nr:hypothetical protein [Candidatus Syntrophocurvum alkaliphilum]QGU00538.1 hypothetical protein SYNTR_1944 [Candidatus Syntrophocurvum alkaliphilum]